MFKRFENRPKYAKKWLINASDETDTRNIYYLFISLFLLVVICTG